MARKRIVIYVGLILFFLAIRLVILLTSLDLFEFEEFKIGMFAKELLSKVTIPYCAYLLPTETHEFGMLLEGYLIAALYRIFGESGVTLKLSWFFISALTFIFYLAFLKKFFSKRMTVLACLFFILCPPLFARANLTDTGAENLALFFTMVITFFNFMWLPFGRDKIYRYMIYGFFSGIAITLSHYCIAIVFTSILYQLCLNWRFFFKKHMLILLTSFLIGWAPWIYINALYDLKWFGYVSQRSPLGIKNLFFLRDKFIKLIIDILPNSFNFKDIFFIKGIILNYIYYFLCILLLITAVFLIRKENLFGLLRYLKNKNNKESLFFIFIIVYILLYLVGESGIIGIFEREYRHLLILYPFIFLSNAVIVDKMLNRGVKWKNFGLIVFLSLGFLGLFGNLSMVEKQNLNFLEPSIYKPYSFLWLQDRIYNYSGRSADKLQSCIKIIQNKYKPYSCGGIYNKMQLGFISNPDVFLTSCRDLGEYQGSFYEGVGVSIGTFFRQEPIFEKELIKKIPRRYRLNKYGILNGDAAESFLKNPDYLKKIGRILNTETANFYYNRVGICMGVMENGRIEVLCSVIEKLDDMFKKSLIEGFAYGLSADRHILDVIKMSEKIDNPYKDDFFTGLGFAFGLKSVPDLKKITEVGETIDKAYQNYYYKGIGKAVGWHSVNDPTFILKLVTARNIEINFRVREHNFLVLAFSEYLTDAYRAAYYRGVGYGIAPYLCSYTAVVLSKWKPYIQKKEYDFLLRGICSYYHDKGSGISSCKKVILNKLSVRILDMYKQIYQN